MIKKNFVLHPFLFSVFPLIFIYVQNIGVISIDIIVLPIVVSIFTVLFLQIGFTFIVRNKHKKGLLISIFLLMFFTYGVLHEKIKFISFFQNYKYLLLIFSTIFFLAAYLINKSKSDFYLTNKVLNIISFCLIAINLFNILSFKFSQEDSPIISSNEQFSLNSNSNPNIFYIILDGYSNSNILKQYYDFDNSEMINYLTDKGFYVTENSTCNYPETFLSLASSLNMNYFEGGKKPKDAFAYEAIQNNYVMQLLNETGYKTINISSNGYVGHIRIADENINPGSILTNEYYYLLFKFTMLKVLRKYIDLEELYRVRILSAFSNLSNFDKLKSQSDEPLFVFAHIFPPHPPYLFGASGEPLNTGFDGDLSLTFWGNEDKYLKDYQNQLTFVNLKMKKVIDDILSAANENTIIIIQSDHGTCQFDYYNYAPRVKIFNAFLLPKDDKNIFYDSISPINTFRLIFNHYFSTNLKLLEDKNYYPENKSPYKFLEVTNEISNKIQ